jgi:DNA mismatch repair protein MSH3
VGFESGLLNEAVAAFSTIRQRVEVFLSQYNTEEAKNSEGRKEDLFRDSDQFPEIDNCKACLAAVEYELEEELNSARKVLSKPSLVCAESLFKDLAVAESEGAAICYRCPRRIFARNCEGPVMPVCC